jgi:hypothetical protein
VSCLKTLWQDRDSPYLRVLISLTFEGHPPRRLVGIIEIIGGFIRVAQERDPPGSQGLRRY